MTRPPPKDRTDPKATEEALRAAYDAIVLRHMQAGWTEAEIALGIEALAQEHIANLGGREAEEVIMLARYEAQFDWLAAETEERAGERWVLAVGAAISCVLLFSGAFLGIWALLRYMR